MANRMGDPHEILGIERNATPEQIKQAYRRAVLAAHPDRGGSSEQFQTVTKAYRSLCDVAPSPTPRREPPRPAPRPRTRSPNNWTRHQREPEIDVWANTPGVNQGDKFWAEYERRKKANPYEEPEEFWGAMDSWSKKKF